MTTTTYPNETRARSIISVLHDTFQNADSIQDPENVGSLPCEEVSFLVCKAGDTFYSKTEKGIPLAMFSVAKSKPEDPESVMLFLKDETLMFGTEV